jgi:hypothetical protein
MGRQGGTAGGVDRREGRERARKGAKGRENRKWSPYDGSCIDGMMNELSFCSSF